MNAKKRATSMTEYVDIIGKIFPLAEINHKEQDEFNLRASDVVITPYSKSGTTWLQQIFHTLRTRGDMDFDDISRVVPWIEVSPGLGLDLNADQRAEPRGFKSHLPFDKIPRGGLYINSIRRPSDVAFSLYKFMEGWFIEPGSISAEDFIRNGFLNSDSYYQHLRSWWAERESESVLYLVYEHMIGDLDGTIKKVADFCDIPLDNELLAITQQHASLEFMKAHRDRFDDSMLRAKTEEIALPKGSNTSKVREGKTNARLDGFSEELKTAFEKKWLEEIRPAIGFDSYEELISSLT